jgi:hypothetical protein
MTMARKTSLESGEIITRAAKKDDQHISAPAGALFTLFMVLGVLGALLMDSRVADGLDRCICPAHDRPGNLFPVRA